MKIPNLLAPGYLHSVLIKAKIKEQNSRFLTHYAAGTVSGLIRAEALENENETRDSLIASLRIQGAEDRCRVYSSHGALSGFSPPADRLSPADAGLWLNAGRTAGNNRRSARVEDIAELNP